ncbi:MAG: hypothetical protein HZC22_02715 [Rhodocyclales bacterium]|nr:hypothetical protein [Rhodocyclales bacterium]
MNEMVRNFLALADMWLCDGYAIDIRYVSLPSAGSPAIASAIIGMGPWPLKKDQSFAISTNSIIAGQVQRYPLNKNELIGIITAATAGRIELADKTLVLVDPPSYRYYSEMVHRDRWFSDLHLHVSGKDNQHSSAELLARIDDDLRASTPPFDGLADLNGWLGTDGDALSGRTSSIVMRVFPPVDLTIGRCMLRGDELTLTLNAHPAFDVRRVGLAIRGIPGDGLSGRRQVAELVEWGEVKEYRREGILRVSVVDCDSVLAVLMVGSSTVRRHWIVDPAKARNSRYVAVQTFDTELRRIREVILESTDSRKFEQGIAALYFLLGYSPVLPIETNAPDIVVSTPGGQLMLVECTIRTSDISSKLGKLVDRRGALSKAFAEAGHQLEVLSALVCRLPRDQIAAQEHQLRSHGVLLIAQEDLLSLIDRVRHPDDPDIAFKAAREKLDLKNADFFSGLNQNS